MPDLVRITVDRSDDIQVVAIRGEIDMASVGDVQGSLLAALDNRLVALVLDLTATTYLDSAAVGLMFELAERLRRHGQSLRLVVPESSLVRKTLLLTGLDRAVSLDPTVEAALGELRAAH